jgi:hypothetical protein
MTRTVVDTTPTDQDIAEARARAIDLAYDQLRDERVTR